MRLETAVVLACALGCASARPGSALAQDPCAQPQVAQLASQARSLVQQKKFVEAEAPARQALASCPAHADGAHALGGSLVGQKRFDDAIAAMSAVIQAKPDVAYAYFWRGQAYYNKKQPDRMVGDFEAFLRLAPNAPEAVAVRQLLSGIKR
ncbi:MAG TPA: tetratricopeptide repeat protein [Vicinamibacteria bacterium]|nr:tetratricopeptide repeat protein [Vicinamibacteria bacterium]